MTLRLHVGILSLLVALSAFALPLFVHAQSADLQATIRQAILSDPRTAGLSATQIDAMVQVLTAAAQKQGITAHDIQWRPQTDATFSDTSQSEAPSCGLIPAPLCALNTAFGFNGSDPTIPIGLGTTSAILILIIGLMLERKRRAALALGTLR